MSPRVATALLAVAVAAVPACGRAAAAPRRVELVARYSAWSEREVVVSRGVPVRFVVRNADPIAHELIVGDAALQQRHELGTEPAHGERPTEVDVPALTTVTTTITFDAPGRYYFACHLPGHYAYGMSGVLEVR